MSLDHLTLLSSRTGKLAAHLTVWAFLFGFSGSSLFAQRNRIAGPINNRQRSILLGHVHPKALSGIDQGAVDPDLALSRVTLTLQPSAAQQADLDQYLVQLQDPSSPDFHHWLTPEEYAGRFGVSQADMDKIVAWLQSQSLSVTGVARARSWVAFSGTAAQVEHALDTEIHHYALEDGTVHFANASDPSIPSALQGVVRSIHGLNDFRLKPPRRAAHALQANYTSTKGNHYLAPGDFAAIYNIAPLYGAGITGAGQKIAVVGQTQIKASDIQQFRSYFGLAANAPQTILVPNTKDPGVVSDDMVEADLDIEWAGAVAPNATVIFVYSYDVMDAVQYAIDQNLAPVLSMSYGLCELLNSTSDIATQQAMAKQANAQGITWFAASGDDGGADCGGGSTKLSGLAVDLPASMPEVTGVGGTTFAEGSGSYWGSTNDGTRSSVLSYIPETSWNDSVADGSPASSGGGVSAHFAKPTWQVGPGVPANTARNVPDVALSASVDHDGYMVYNDGSIAIIGGTSAGAPSFAGITALLNQYLQANGFQSTPGLGNINPRLYSLAQSTPNAFHDITTGDNMVSACTGRRGCTAGSVGYSAGVGYDQVTGLGSVDAYTLVTNWHASGSISKSTANVVITSSASTVIGSETFVLTATVSSLNGGTPTGTVSFYVGPTNLGTAPVQSGTATLSVNASQLSAGTATITAQYSGDAGYNFASGSINISVLSPGNTGTPTIEGLTNGASFTKTYAPGMLLSIFGAQLAPATQSATSVPLPTQLVGVSATMNGLNAPLYYVSPSQLNVQIPYELTAGQTPVLTINNNGQTTTVPLTLTAAAPGIFVDANQAPVPSTSAKPGQSVTLFITGAGALSPAVASGTGPAAGTPAGSLPKPVLPVSLTVGGKAATIQFVGNPAGLVGVTQINYQVPSSLASGTRQTVVVTVGGVASSAANLTVTQ